MSDPDYNHEYTVTGFAGQPIGQLQNMPPRRSAAASTSNNSPNGGANKRRRTGGGKNFMKALAEASERNTAQYPALQQPAPQQLPTPAEDFIDPSLREAVPALSPGITLFTDEELAAFQGGDDKAKHNELIALRTVKKPAEIVESAKIQLEKWLKRCKTQFPVPFLDPRDGVPKFRKGKCNPICISIVRELIRRAHPDPDSAECVIYSDGLVFEDVERRNWDGNNATIGSPWAMDRWIDMMMAKVMGCSLHPETKFAEALKVINPYMMEFLGLRASTNDVLRIHPYYEESMIPVQDALKLAVTAFFNNVYRDRIGRMVLGYSINSSEHILILPHFDGKKVLTKFEGFDELDFANLENLKALREIPYLRHADEIDTTDWSSQ